MHRHEQPFPLRHGLCLAQHLGDGHAVAFALRQRDCHSFRFAVALPALPAGGPFTLAVTAPSGTAQARDILVGDVFLCSGQSNMELQVQNAQDAWNQSQASADDKLRLMTVAKATALAPRADFAQAPSWVVAAPETVRPFSAACYYMVQDLRKRTGVPIGAINSSWGGTQISSWMGETASLSRSRLLGVIRMSGLRKERFICRLRMWK